MHIYHMEEWQDPIGYWHCNDTNDLAHNSGVWYLPARILNMSPAKYIEWVINTYKPDEVSFGTDATVVSFKWKSQSQMRAFKNFINKKAREKNFEI